MSPYDLFSYTGTDPFAQFSLSGSLPESNFLTTPSSTALTRIDLAVTFKGLSWTGRTGGTGAVNGSWDVATSNNWANSVSAASTYTDGQGVLFGDKNPLSAVRQQCWHVDDRNPRERCLTRNVAIHQHGRIRRGRRLHVERRFDQWHVRHHAQRRSGGVTLQSANAFSGPAAVNFGHLQLQNGTALGNSSGVTVASGAALELALRHGTTTTYGSRADSSGTIPLASAARSHRQRRRRLNSINGINTYAGADHYWHAGATIDSNSSANGDGLTLSGAITLPAAATLNVLGVVGGVTFSGGVTIGSGSTVNIAGGGNVTLSGGVTTGSGSTLNIAGGGIDTVNTLPVSGGASIIYAGPHRFVDHRRR